MTGGKITGCLVRAALVFAGVIFACLLAEIFLRLYLPFDQYFVWPPEVAVEFQPLPEAMPGISGPARFEINRQGMRGEDMPVDDTVKILVLGGSTAECTYLDQHETWPHLIQEALNRRPGPGRYWVGNAARSGQNTRDHRLHIRYLLDQYDDIDSVLLLCGINDFALRLARGGRYDPDFLSDPSNVNIQMKHAFSIYPLRWDAPFYKRTALWRLAGTVRKTRTQKELFQDRQGKFYIRSRAKRYQAVHDGKILPELPDMASALDEYKRNLEKIIDCAETKQVRLILLTQPALWRPGLEEPLRDLLWLGWEGGSAAGRRGWYYAVEALSRGLGMYNDAMRHVCRHRGVACVDLAGLLSGDATIFFDDVHFTEEGARQISRAVVPIL